MKTYIKASMVALAVTAAGATAAMAGKATTPNTLAPPVVITVTQTLTGLTPSSFQSGESQSVYIRNLLEALGS